MKPTRIQRSRKAGSTTLPGTKYCGRPGRWGNPFAVNRHDANYWRVSVRRDCRREIKTYCVEMLLLEKAGFKTKHEAQAHATKLFSKLLAAAPQYYPVQELAGYAHLSCWCALDEPCHVDEIIKKM